MRFLLRQIQELSQIMACRLWQKVYEVLLAARDERIILDMNVVYCGHSSAFYNGLRSAFCVSRTILYYQAFDDEEQF